MKNFGLKEGVFVLLGVMVLFAPILAFGGRDTVYVDKNASGSENGTKDKPYHTIGAALKHAKDDTIVLVKKGEYKENITIPKDVKVTSEKNDRDKVVIIGNDNDETVLMKDGSELSKVTIRKGQHGIRIDQNAEAHIFDVLVKESDRDGVHIDSSNKKDKKHRVFLDKVEVQKSGRTGVYSEKRFVVITKSNIHHNNLDGIDFQGDVKAWIEDTRISANRGSGLKVDLNGAEVWTNKLSIRENKREGVEVHARTAQAGKFGLKKATIIGNDRYGVAKIRRGIAPADLLAKNVFIEASRVETNTIGAVSPVIWIK